MRYEVDATLTLKWHLAVEAPDVDVARDIAQLQIGERANDADLSDMQVIVERGVS